MPRKILHCLFTHQEELEMRVNGFGLDTHGIQHIVLQFERGRRKLQMEELQEPAASKLRLPSHTRKKTATCNFCKKLCVPQGLWKHEKFCEKRGKGGK